MRQPTVPAKAPRISLPGPVAEKGELYSRMMMTKFSGHAIRNERISPATAPVVPQLKLCAQFAVRNCLPGQVRTQHRRCGHALHRSLAPCESCLQPLNLLPTA